MYNSKVKQEISSFKAIWRKCVTYNEHQASMTTSFSFYLSIIGNLYTYLMGLEPTTDNSSLHHVLMGEGGSILLELLVLVCMKI